MHTQVLMNILFSPKVPPLYQDEQTFLQLSDLKAAAQLAEVLACDLSLAHLMVMARQAERRSSAGIAAHQNAIRRLFPNTPATAITAFCISEDKGPRPSHIHTSLTQDEQGDGWTLNGHKKWGSMAPLATIAYVAASIGRLGAHNQLRMVQLPTGRAGVSIDSSPYAGRRPYLQIADLHFKQVKVQADEIIDQDAYTEFIKPFRLIEDVYGVLALHVALFNQMLIHNWPEADIEKLLNLIMQGFVVASTGLTSAQEVVLMSAYFSEAEAHWRGLQARWQAAPAKELWQPDKGLLEVAAQARAIRRQQAWSELRS